MARLVLGIDARPARQGAQEFDRATGRVTQSARQAAQATDRVGNSFQRLRPAVQAASGALTALGGALAIRQFVRYADAATQIESRLRLVTSSTEELASTQRRLFNIAQETRADFQSTVTLYQKLSRATEQLNLSQSDLFQITRTVNQAIAVSGASATEASAALLQLSQGLASGQLRGEELNSVLEQTPRLARAIANGAGIAFGELRKAAEEGKLTAEVTTDALLDSAGRVEAEYAKVDRTISQAFTQLNNALLRSIGIVDDGTNATEDLATALDDVREVVGSESFQDGLGAITSFIGNTAELGGKTIAVIGGIAEAVNRLNKAVSEFAGFDFSFLGGNITNPFGALSLAEQIERLGGGGSGKIQGFDGGTRINEVLQFSRTVGLGEGGSSASGGGGPNVPAPNRVPFEERTAFADQLARERDRRLTREAEAFAEAEQFGFDRSEELRRQAERLRSDLNPALSEYQERIRQIEASSPFLSERDQLELRIQAGERLNEQIGETESGLQNAQKAADQLGFSFSSAFEDAIVKGQEFSTVLQGLAEDILRILVRTQITQPAAGALSNLFSSGFDALFSSGGGTTGAAVPTSQGGLGQPLPRASGGPVTAGESYIVGEKRPELFVPRQSGTILPSVPQGGGKTEVNVYSSGGEEPEIRRSRNGNGGERIDVILDRKIQEAAASGKLDKPMRARYGINPSTGTR